MKTAPTCDTCEQWEQENTSVKFTYVQQYPNKNTDVKPLVTSNWGKGIDQVSMTKEILLNRRTSEIWNVDMTLLHLHFTINYISRLREGGKFSVQWLAR
jgi:hypothetical protein